MKAEVNAPWHDGTCYFTHRDNKLAFFFSWGGGSDNYELDLKKETSLKEFTNKEVNDSWTMKSILWKSAFCVYNRKFDWHEHGRNYPVGPVIFSKERVDHDDEDKK